MNLQAGYVPLVELTRGGIVECIHYGVMAVVDSSSQLLAAAGDTKLKNFPRSSLKPLQALPFIERGGAEVFGLQPKEISILCASHTGTDEHFAVLSSLHEKTGLKEEYLQCGVHWPTDRATAEMMRQRAEEPTPFRHNCSGKHTGMLLHAKLRGESLSNYLDISHPVQQSILDCVDEMCKYPREKLVIGTDGCSAPVFALPIENMALGIARFCDPLNLFDKRKEACQKITHAMTSEPLMVAGPGRLDSILMKLLNGKVIAKGGAEGYQIIGIMPDALKTGSPGIGIAFKFSDGDPSRRATYMLTRAILKAVGLGEVLNDPEFAVFNDATLRNWRGLEIGNIRLSFPFQVEL